MPRPRPQAAGPPSSQVIELTDDHVEINELADNTSRVPSDQPKLDMTSAIALWKTNPQLYIQLEREKTLIRRASQKGFATFQSRGPPVPLTVFPIFGRLPYELRRMIWKLAMKHPRVVEIVLDRWTAEEARNCNLKSLTCCPAILHVNFESREIGQKKYQHITVYRTKAGVKTFGITYANWDVDTIVFKSANALNKFLTNQSNPDNAGSPITTSCKKLAVASDCLNKLRLGVAGSFRFEKIEELYILFDYRSDHESTTSVSVGEPGTLSSHHRQRVNGFKAVMAGHPTLKLTAVKRLEGRICKNHLLAGMEVEKTPEEKQRMADRRYDADLLFAANLQEELERRA